MVLEMLKRLAGDVSRAQKQYTTYHASTLVVVDNISIVQLAIGVRLGQQCFRFPLGPADPLVVRLLVEIGEQEQEHDTVQSDPHHETLRVVALGEQQLELVREDGDELGLQSKGWKK